MLPALDLHSGPTNGRTNFRGILAAVRCVRVHQTAGVSPHCRYEIWPSVAQKAELWVPGIPENLCNNEILGRLTGGRDLNTT